MGEVTHFIFVLKALKLQKEIKILKTEYDGKELKANIFYRVNPGNHLEQHKEEFKQSWTGSEGFNSYFCITFDHMLKKFHFWKGGRALPNFKIFPIYPNFMRFQIFAHLKSTWVNVFYTTFQVPLYLWQIANQTYTKMLQSSTILCLGL